jgi:hypothetical protein
MKFSTLSRFAFLRPKLQRCCGHCSHKDPARYCISAFPAHWPSGRLASTRALFVCLFARSTHWSFSTGCLQLSSALLNHPQSFDAYSSIVWSTNPSHAERLVSLSSAEFCEELNYALQTPPHSVSSQYTAAYARKRGTVNSCRFLLFSSPY